VSKGTTMGAAGPTGTGTGTAVRPARLAARRTPPSLGRSALFEGAPEDLLRAVEARFRAVHWERGEPQPPGLDRPDHLFVVLEGLVGLIALGIQGRPVTAALIGPGMLYSTLGCERPSDACALQTSAIVAIPAAAVRRLIDLHPGIGANLAEALSQRAASLRDAVAQVSQMRVEDRLLGRLHELCEHFGRASVRGIELRLDLTHAQWGLLAGASRVATTSALILLRKRGRIVADGRTIVVPWQVVRSDLWEQTGRDGATAA